MLDAIVHTMRKDVDPPVTPESIASALAAQRKERTEIVHQLVDDGAPDLVRAQKFPVETVEPQAWERLDAIETLHGLMRKFGTEKVHTWLVNLAADRGEAIPCSAPPQ